MSPSGLFTLVNPSLVPAPDRNRNRSGAGTPIIDARDSRKAAEGHHIFHLLPARSKNNVHVVLHLLDIISEVILAFFFGSCIPNRSSRVCNAAWYSFMHSRLENNLKLGSASHVSASYLVCAFVTTEDSIPACCSMAAFKCRGPCNLKCFCLSCI